MLENLERERKATWLELFYDLIYVAAIAKILTLLETNTPGESGRGYLVRYFLTFLPFWWCWLGHTLIQNQINHENWKQKLFTFMKMFLVIILVTFATGKEKIFIGVYCLVRLSIIINYMLIEKDDVKFRALALRITKIYLSGLFLGVTALFVGGKIGYLLFYSGIFLEIILTLLSKKQFDGYPLHREHLVERLGLFTIILMGEGVAAIAMNLYEIHHLRGWENAIIDFILLCSIWVIYYESTLKNIIKYEAKNEMLLIFGHLPLHVSLGIISVVLGAAVEREMEWDKFIYLTMAGFFLFFLSKQLLRNIDSFSWETVFFNIFKGGIALFIPLWIYLKNARDYQEVVLLLSISLLISIVFIIYRENRKAKSE